MAGRAPAGRLPRLTVYGRVVDLTGIVTEIERHLDGEGWGSPPRLYALVRTGDLLANEPALAATLGDADPDSLTPVEQEPIEEDVADLLPRIVWPAGVVGCALAHEALAVPAERQLRAVAAVLRTGETAAVLRVRGGDGGTDEVVVGPDIVPNMVAALRDTLAGED